MYIYKEALMKEKSFYIAVALASRGLVFPVCR
jgi:hypothetical protein